MDQNSQNNVLTKKLKNHLAYFDFDAIFDFVGQFTKIYT